MFADFLAKLDIFSWLVGTLCTFPSPFSLQSLITKQNELRKKGSKEIPIKCVVVGDSSVGKEYKSYLYLK